MIVTNKPYTAQCLALIIMYVNSPNHILLVHPEVWATMLAGCRQLFDYGTEVFSGKGEMWYSTWSPLLPFIQVLLSEYFPLSLLMHLQLVHLWPLCWSKWCMCSTQSTIKLHSGLAFMASNPHTTDIEAQRDKFACNRVRICWEHGLYPKVDSYYLGPRSHSQCWHSSSMQYYVYTIILPVTSATLHCYTCRGYCWSCRWSFWSCAHRCCFDSGFSAPCA